MIRPCPIVPEDVVPRYPAWRTRLWGIESVVFAESRAKAKAATVRGAQGAGYAARFTDSVIAVRAPDLDALSTLNEPGRCLSERFLTRSAN